MPWRWGSNSKKRQHTYEPLAPLTPILPVGLLLSRESPTPRCGVMVIGLAPAASFSTEQTEYLARRHPCGREVR